MRRINLEEVEQKLDALIKNVRKRNTDEGLERNNTGIAVKSELEEETAALKTVVSKSKLRGELMLGTSSYKFSKSGA